MLFALHRSQLEKLGAQPGEALRQAQGANEQIVAQQLGNGLLEQVQATTITGRYPDSLRFAVGITLNLRLDPFKQIEFVIDLEHRQVLGANLTQNHHHLLDLLQAIGLVSVDDVQQQVRVARFLERSPKGLDQLVRQRADETHRIGQHDRAKVVELETAQCRVQGCEQLVSRVDVGVGHRIEQRRLAGVCVAHDGDCRDVGTRSTTTGLITLTADLLQTPLDLAQANPQQTTVGFQLGFTRTAQADTTALTFKVSPAANQARTHVLELRQFDLQLAFMSARALGEDVQDQARTIKHATLENAFEVAFLTGREDMIEDDNIGFFGLDEVTQLFDLAATYQIFGRWPMPRHVDKRNDIGTCRQSQLPKLLRIFARLRVLTIQMNEDCPLTTTVALKEQGRLLSGVTWLSVTLFGFGSARQTNWTNWNNSRDGVLVNHLADSVLQQNDELVERLDRALQLDTVYQINRNPNLFFTQSVQVRVL